MDVVSQCALGVANVVWRTTQGGFAFTLVCKATFTLQPGVSPLAAQQEPVVLADEYDGASGALAIASDLVPAKRRPEVLLTGPAYAPDGRPALSLVARLVVGEIDKSIQVVGDRYFGLDGKLSDPEYFARMPLGWERAAVGPDRFNPAGRSLGNAAQPDAFDRFPAVNLLPVGLQTRSRRDIVPAVGFGPVAPRWPSRAACLRQHAADWSPGRWHERPLPPDIDLAYFNAAPSDQQRALPFGEESIYLENLHPRFGQLATRLAPIAPAATVDLGAGPQPLQLRCDTLIIDTNRGIAMLVWRGQVLLAHPDSPGRVVVTSRAVSQAPSPEWTAGAVDAEAMISSRDLMRSTVVLRSSDVAAVVQEQAAPARIGAIPASIYGNPSNMTMAPAYNPPEAVLPFAASPGDSTPRREAPPVEQASALPFARSPADGAGDDPGAPRRLDLLRSTPLRAASWTPGLRETMPQSAPASPWTTSVPDATSTLLPGAFARAAAILPFSATTAVAPEQAAPARIEATPPPIDDSAIGETMVPGFVIPAAVLPFLAAQRGLAPGRAAPSVESAAAVPFTRGAPPEPDAMERAAEPAPPPPPALDTPAPPPMIGPIAIVSAEIEAAPDSDAPVPVKATEPEPEPEIAIDFDVYPPSRCGGIAARLACADGDEGRANEVLRAEDLDAARWQRVRDHWLDRLREEAARSRKKLQSEYDGAYVAALERERGTIALEEYARLAEAAERGEVTGALAEARLPEGAWPRIHRVWIGQMVKDARLGKQVRAAIEARRTAR